MTRFVKAFCLLFILSAEIIYPAQLTGLIKNALSGSPVVNASITAVGFRAGAADSIIVTSSTNESGIYNFTVPSNAKYYLTVQKEGFSPITAGPIQAVDSVYRLNISMQPIVIINGTVTGKVYDFITGMPLQNVEMSLIPLGALPYMLTATTNENGTFAFYNVSGGKYILKAEKTGYQSYQYPDTFIITNSNVVQTNNIYLHPAGSSTSTLLKGRVTNGQSSMILPVPGALIKLTGLTNYLSLTAITDSLGYYSIPDVFPGFYLIDCSATGMQGMTKIENIQGAVLIVNFYLLPAAPGSGNFIAGSVRDDSLRIMLTGVTATIKSMGPTPVVFTNVTPSNGTYQFKRVPAGSYQLSVELSGYQSYTLPFLIPIDTNSVVLISDIFLKKIALPDYANIFGGVYKQTSGVLYLIRGATVKFSMANGTNTYTTVSDSQGQYVLNHVPYGVYLAACSAEGYTPVSATVNVQTATVQWPFYLPPAASNNNLIAGKVFDDSTHQPLSNVELMMSVGLVMPPIYQALSGTDGSFKFTMLPIGDYILRAELDGYEPFRYSTTIHVDSTTNITNLVINMKRTVPTPVSVIHGKVTTASNSQPVPIPNASIKISDGYGTVFTSTSDSLGAFTVPNVPYGNYTGICEAFAFQPQSITFTVQNATTNIVFSLTQNTTFNNLLSGHVVDDSLFHPLVGTKLTLKPLAVYSFLYTTYSDSTGFFKFQNIYPTTYILEAAKEGYLPYQYSRQFVFDVASQFNGLQVVMKKYEITPGFSRVSGSVITNTFVPYPIPGAFLKFFRNDTICYITKSDTAGRYMLPKVRYGIYKITCSANNFQSETRSVTICEPLVNCSFYLTPLGTGSAIAKGRVTFDNSGSPVSGALIEFIPQVSTGSAFTALTDESGYYSIPLSSGSYIAACSYKKPDWGYVYKEYFDNVLNISQATVIPVRQNDTVSNINFGIPQIPTLPQFNITVKGIVCNNSNLPLEAAEVSIYMLFYNNPIHATALTDANGRYEINMQLSLYDSLQNIFAVMAEKEGFKTEFFKDKPSITLADKFYVFRDTVYKDVNFTLDPVGTGTTYTISGKVTGTGSAPIGGAFVICANAATAELSFAFSDAVGKYSIGSLKTGKYYLLFAATGYIPEFYNNVLCWENATPIIVNANITNINAELAPAILLAGNSSTITGIVTDGSGGVLQNVLVTLNNSSGDAVNYTFTDANGAYEMLGLQPGSYTLNATKVAYNSYAHTFQYNTQMGSIFMHSFSLSPAAVSVEQQPEDEVLPSSFSLRDNYPNPFNPSTTICFDLPSPARVRLAIYNVLGNCLAVLVDGDKQPGHYEISWNASKFPSGVYYYELNAGSFKRVKKMVLTK